MKNKFAIFALSGLVLTVLSCSRPDVFNADQVRVSIEEETALYVEAIRQGDVEAMLACYTDNATVIPADGEILRGKQAISEFYEALLQMGLKDIDFFTLEVDGCGDLAYETGKTRVLIETESGEIITDSTKYLVIWQRQPDGAWKVHIDIFNFFGR
ncbi:MAG: SgcJ/EcaC family oxidoreductase [Bacteroidales bacterium]